MFIILNNYELHIPCCLDNRYYIFGPLIILMTEMVSYNNVILWLTFPALYCKGCVIIYVRYVCFVIYLFFSFLGGLIKMYVAKAVNMVLI